jgi:hypothetical protein
MDCTINFVVCRADQGEKGMNKVLMDANNFFKFGISLFQCEYHFVHISDFQSDMNFLVWSQIYTEVAKSPPKYQVGEETKTLCQNYPTSLT